MISLVTALRARGVEFALVDARVRYRPRRLVRTGELENLRVRKADLLAVLHEDSWHEAHPWPEPSDIVWFSELVPADQDCRACGQGRWWRLKTVGRSTPRAWTCARCHPPSVPEAEVEFASELAELGLPHTRAQDDDNSAEVAL